ncbi:TPA: LysR family transcriptional regulator [Klebsiella pneumoniae]|uniref:LysR substrate-binding domain-containing protein n=1 Tax=Klebsiella pneumoniae TaxID=573 RepID=UPI001BCE0193|nr:LysR substrate-binding domain-containing protein [Klebsiella pneumoniae]MCX2322758.1 LysR substrate-binding domain-containing protein [Klebsiella pneumoniae]MDF9922115.1 LysR substrate-binding domain-containing protein [Klebsiella pneumoniae]MEB5984438.1 LysR substrate-binding domain-containing protein [Klebsiella pneumoniae]HBR7795967.1 LysR family transcriptional regulator [Klebsiella pneumoniae]HBR7810717.1 LysR family transcriptional regulator [Klebsiella pneumoniae]
MKHKTQIMNNLPLLNDLRVFMLVARRAGFAAAAEELGVSPAFVSKRVSLLEQTLNVMLLHRTTRRVTITEEGERIYEWAQRILQDVNEMMDELSDVRQVPQGTLRIISSFGFGRRVVAPALSALALQYPQLELRFDVQDRLVDLVNEGVDLDIRVGDDIAPNLIARQLAANHRVLCASPQFLARHASPKQLSDLAALPCLVIKERDHPFGVWQLHSKEGQHAIKVTGPLSSNHGEIVHQWCLDGQGIALRSWWDVRENIASGHLVQVLPDYWQPANVWAVYVSRLATSAKIRTTVEFLRHYFQLHYPQHEPTASAVGRGD